MLLFSVGLSKEVANYEISQHKRGRASKQKKKIVICLLKVRTIYSRKVKISPYSNGLYSR